MGIGEDDADDFAERLATSVTSAYIRHTSGLDTVELGSHDRIDPLDLRALHLDLEVCAKTQYGADRTLANLVILPYNLRDGVCVNAYIGWGRIQINVVPCMQVTHHVHAASVREPRCCWTNAVYRRKERLCAAKRSDLIVPQLQGLSQC
jgi:hypothetical protein